MRFLGSSLLLGLLCLGQSSGVIAGSNTTTEEAFHQVVANYDSVTARLLCKRPSGICSRRDLIVRRSWDDLNRGERLDYINAVKCLQALPSIVDKALAPGAKTRADDFTFAHINQTNFVHASGIFFPWHRQYIWAYEQALRNECDYKGGVPYWDWFKHTQDQSKSPVFSGGPDGFGGNGQTIPHSATNQSLIDIPGPIFAFRDAGTGGGCVTDGAFSDLVINLGPVVPAENPPNDRYGLRGNPHCLKRDFLQFWSTEFLTYDNAMKFFGSPDYASAHLEIDLGGIHAGAHHFAGGDLYDIYSSPSDPLFFLLHSQIDRLWAVWQAQDYQIRKGQVAGTVTFGNLPPSENATLDTLLKMGPIPGGDVTFGQTVSPLENSYCYSYA